MWHDHNWDLISYSDYCHIDTIMFFLFIGTLIDIIVTHFLFLPIWSCEYHEVLYWNIIHFQFKTLRCSHHFKVDSSVVFSTLTVVQPPQQSNLRTCRLAVIFIPLLSSATGSYWHIFCLWICLFWDISYKWNCAISCPGSQGSFNYHHVIKIYPWCSMCQ